MRLILPHWEIRAHLAVQDSLVIFKQVEFLN